MSVTIAAACGDFFGKDFLKRLFLASSLLLMLAGLVRAQSYPEFDGVYFKMSDGSFVELAEVGKVQPLGRAFLPSENWLNQPEGLWQVDQFSNAPVIDPESAQSLVIVGRSFRDLRWTPFNSFNDRYKDFIPDPQLPTKFDDYTQNIRESTDVNLLLGGNYIYRGNCGLDETSVKVRRVSDFVTELLPDGYRWPSAQNFSTADLRDRGCIWQPMPAQVVEIVVDGNFYAFRPKVAQVASAMQSGESDIWLKSAGSDETLKLNETTESSSDTYIGFQSPTGNIHCSIQVLGGITYATCVLQEFTSTFSDWPDGCDGLNREFFVSDLGYGALSCSDANIVNSGNSVVAYGDSINFAGIECVSAKIGMRCTNADGHGFNIAKTRQSIY